MKKVLYCILASIAHRFQAYLSRRALNNGVSDKYDWSKEIVVVTGGAGGMGGEIVKMLASKGTRVAVLDILPLTYPKRKCVGSRQRGYSTQVGEDILHDALTPSSS